jgi:uncharacterized membrane protein
MLSISIKEESLLERLGRFVYSELDPVVGCICCYFFMGIAFTLIFNGGNVLGNEKSLGGILSNIGYTIIEILLWPVILTYVAIVMLRASIKNNRRNFNKKN